ncbi:MAG: hypothetical protein A2289_03585 [Deltaproteobacteria bacterium RIFOXYA12_FULL_58_15]|nr:MAG: hypothetical protein A2289_03585 [Deltaproteobacteria bacterium RIFOXYA12_FULL_58_15]
MSKSIEANAIIYCEGAFATTNGKTAHGLIRRSRRYRILSVVDSSQSGSDAAELLDGIARQIPIHASLTQAVESARLEGHPATHLIVGIAPDGGRLSEEARTDIKSALGLGLSVVCGLHDYLTEDPEMSRIAEDNGVTIRDIRKPPHTKGLHFFSGKIEQVKALRVAILGTDSAVGKRTTAWILVDALRQAGFAAEMVGTGQTAWLQGAPFSIIMDSLPNDFVSGEIEHAVWQAWEERHPDVIVIEGQGSLLNPAYPGGFEILAAGRPDVIVLQHAPGRRHYDGFPNHPMQPLQTQIQAIELISEKPVVAITINAEGLGKQELAAAIKGIETEMGRPTVDVLREGPEKLIHALRPLITKRQAPKDT